jgi:predicted ribosomally synthesized peptide with nif11-like leader|tara:strand:- start:90 stop:407 length:318 start_codon:yes stop_codon:yes gene_type:complete
MSKENLGKFMTQVAGSEELQARIGEEIDAEALISLGAECGCELTAEDLQESMELSDEELDDVAGGYAQQARIERPNTLKVNMLNDTENRWQRELNLITAYWGNNN